MHPEAYHFVATVARDHHACAPVYEIGSRNINGTIRGVFHGLGAYLGVDVAPGPGVDLVVDAATFTPPSPPATVICCEVLEHTAAAQTIVTQAARVLAPGGLLIITTAGDGRAPHSAIDGGVLRDGEYYQNLTIREITQWAADGGVDALRASATDNYGDLYYVGRKRGGK